MKANMTMLKELMIVHENLKLLFFFMRCEEDSPMIHALKHNISVALKTIPPEELTHLGLLLKMFKEARGTGKMYLIEREILKEIHIIDDRMQNRA